MDNISYISIILHKDQGCLAGYSVLTQYLIAPFRNYTSKAIIHCELQSSNTKATPQPFKSRLHAEKERRKF